MTDYQYEKTGQTSADITGCLHIQNTLYIPASLDGNSVRGIGRNAFHGQTKLRHLIIEEGIGSIGPEAFSGCDRLETVVLPQSLLYIGSGAFSHCHSLRSIVLPSGLLSIGPEAFEDCRNLSKILLPDSITVISGGLFRGCSALEEIFLPNSLSEVRGNAFESCVSLSACTLPDTVTQIGNQAFYGCTALKEFTFPKSLTVIGESVFGCCTSLQTIYTYHWVFQMGFLGNTAHADIAFLDQKGNVFLRLFYTDDWRSFLPQGRAQLMLSLYHAPEHIDYPLYDDTTNLLLLPQDRAYMSLLRLLYPVSLPKSIQKKYEEFISLHIAELFPIILERNLADGLLLLTRRGLIPLEFTDTAIRLCLEEGRTDFTAILLNYKNSLSGGSSLDRLFLL